MTGRELWVEVGKLEASRWGMARLRLVGRKPSIRMLEKLTGRLLMMNAVELTGELAAASVGLTGKLPESHLQAILLYVLGSCLSHPWNLLVSYP